MPNCDWYGALDDHRMLLEHVFQQTELSVWEDSTDLSSESRTLRRFNSADEVMREFDKPHPISGKEIRSVYLMLYVEGSCVRGFAPRKKYGREFAEGFGLIQFYLERPSQTPSHSNHNSERRAQNWDHLAEYDSADDWNFELVTKTSSRLNRFIRKCGKQKIGSRVILPGASELLRTGKADFLA